MLRVSTLALALMCEHSYGKTCIQGAYREGGRDTFRLLKDKLFGFFEVLHT